MADNFHDWGEALVKLHRYGEAIQKLLHAVKLNPEAAPSYVEWGRALEGQGDLRGAIQKYQKAIDTDENNPWAHKYLSDVMRKTGEIGEAREQSNKVKLNSDLANEKIEQICQKVELHDLSAALKMQDDFWLPTIII